MPRPSAFAAVVCLGSASYAQGAGAYDSVQLVHLAEPALSEQLGSVYETFGLPKPSGEELEAHAMSLQSDGFSAAAGSNGLSSSSTSSLAFELSAEQIARLFEASLAAAMAPVMKIVTLQNDFQKQRAAATSAGLPSLVQAKQVKFPTRLDQEKLWSELVE